MPSQKEKSRRKTPKKREIAKYPGRPPLYGPGWRVSVERPFPTDTRFPVSIPTTFLLFLFNTDLDTGQMPVLPFRLTLSDTAPQTPALPPPRRFSFHLRYRPQCRLPTGYRRYHLSHPDTDPNRQPGTDFPTGKYLISPSDAHVRFPFRSEKTKINKKFTDGI